MKTVEDKFENFNMEGKILICYHKEDNDGVFSGALLYNYCVYNLQCEKEDIVLLGLNYNESKSINSKTLKAWREVYNHLFITDFSLPIPFMKRAHKLWGNCFLWFDHHKPVIEASMRSSAGKLCECRGERCIDRSAILCVYKYLYDPFDSDRLDNPNNIPELLRILSGWDSFTYEKEGFTLDYVRKVNYGITHLFNLDIIEVARALQFNDKDDMERLKNRAYNVGKILVDDENIRMANIIKNSGDMEWKIEDSEGHIRTACAIFNEGPSNSQMFDSVKDKVKNGIVFKRNSDGTWTVSLYNIIDKDTWHVGNFCREKYKGGGHQGAGGFQIKQSKMIALLRSKTL